MYLKKLGNDPKFGVLPEVLSFDEKFLNREIATNGFSFITIDWKKIKLIDMLSTRHTDELWKYFQSVSSKNRADVRYITMDMYDTYLRIANVFFAHAKVAIDSFHVLKHLKATFDHEKHKFMWKFDNGAEILENNSENYYLISKYSSLLYDFYGNLSNDLKYNKKLGYHISNRGMVNLIINIDPNLKKAHQLSQDYREFNCLQSREEAEKEIDEIIEKIDQSKLNSFKDFSNMLKTWKEYILNSFIKITDANGKIRRLSDGPTEGINNSIWKNT